MRKRLRLPDDRLIGRMMPGDKARNPRAAAGENIRYIEENPELRYRFNAKPGEVRNPYGRKGYAGMGLEKPMSISKKELMTTMEARELMERARQLADKAMQVYEDIMDSDTAADTAKIAAANAVIDRGFGKATQTNVTAQVNADGKPSEIDDRELAARIEDAVERVRRVTTRAEQEAAGAERPADIRKFN